MRKGQGWITKGQITRPAPRKSLILTVWAETQPGQPPVWRGSIETADRKRYYFDQISGLTRLLKKLGWQDPPISNGEDGPPT